MFPDDGWDASLFYDYLTAFYASPTISNLFPLVLVLILVPTLIRFIVKLPD